MTRAERERTNKLARVHQQVAAIGRRGWDTRVAEPNSAYWVNCVPSVKQRRHQRRHGEVCELCAPDAMNRRPDAVTRIANVRCCEHHAVLVLAIALEATHSPRIEP